jgi:hypothetical protein
MKDIELLCHTGVMREKKQLVSTLVRPEPYVVSPAVRMLGLNDMVSCIGFSSGSLSHTVHSLFGEIFQLFCNVDYTLPYF